MPSFTYKGQSYRWHQHRWFDQDHLVVDDKTARELDARFPRPPLDASALARRRRDLKGSGATLLAPQQMQSRDAATVAVTCGLYRDSGQLEKALSVTEPWKDSNKTAVLIARAAVLCDLGRWLEAKNLIKKAVRLGGGLAARNVLWRIEREFGPD